MAPRKKTGQGNRNSSPITPMIPACIRVNGPDLLLYAPGSVPMSSTSGVRSPVIRKSKSQEYGRPQTSSYVPRRRTSPSCSMYHPHWQSGMMSLSPPQFMVSHSSPPSYHSSPHQSTQPHRRRIQFYHKHQAYYGFTNFSPHRVSYNNKMYPTSEHLFQSLKFEKNLPDLAEHIRTFSEWPSVAFSEARRFQPEIRSDWNAVKIGLMELTLHLKFTQHKDLKDELLGTGDAELIEASDKDGFWGWGADTQGRNELGKCLERLRAQLRK